MLKKPTNSRNKAIYWRMQIVNSDCTLKAEDLGTKAIWRTEKRNLGTELLKLFWESGD